MRIAIRPALERARRCASCCMLLAVFLSSTARAAQSGDATAPADEHRARTTGTIVLLGEAFELSPDQCRTALESSRSGDRVWIAPNGADTARGIDPLAHSDDPAPATRELFDARTPHPGDDAALCERVRRAGSVALVGGKYLDWYALFRPQEKRSGLDAALRYAHRSGATVIASGAAASFLADWTVVDRAEIDRPRRNPRDAREHVLLHGMSLVHGMIVDASGAPRASWSRWLSLVANSQGELALYVDAHVAWILRDEERGEALVRGSGAAFVLDLHGARRERDALLGARLSMLLDGDRWSARERRASTATRTLVAGARVERPAITLDAPASGDEVRVAIARELDASRATLATLSAPEWFLALRSDSGSAFAVDAQDRTSARAGIALDFAWGERAALR